MNTLWLGNVAFSTTPCWQRAGECARPPCTAAVSGSSKNRRTAASHPARHHRIAVRALRGLAQELAGLRVAHQQTHQAQGLLSSLISYRARNAHIGMLWRSQLTVGPWLTEAICLACQSPQAILQLLVVPGNPGQCSFYYKFMEQLHSVFQGKADIMAVSHVGHDSDNLTQGKVWCLDSQISHKVQLLRDHMLGPDKPPVVVIAHSIGSYIMLQAIKQLEDELTDAADAAAAEALKQQLPKVVLLTPFLAADWSSPQQRALRIAARAAPILAAAAAAVGSLPAWIQDRLIPLLQPGTEPHAWASLKDLMSYSSAYNNFHLARHEFRDLDAPVDWQLISRLGNRAAVVCAPQDMWFPMQHYEQMCCEVPEVEEYWRDDLTHAFCMETRQCKVAAQLVHQSVTTSLPTQLAQQLQVKSNVLTPSGKQIQQQSVQDSRVDTPVALGEQTIGTVVDMLVEVEPDSRSPEVRKAVKHPQAVRSLL